jgi:hypothetical protein
MEGPPSRVDAPLSSTRCRVDAVDFTPGRWHSLSAFIREESVSAEFEPLQQSCLLA